MALDNQLNGVGSLAGVFLFLTTATTLLRLVARFKQGAKVWVDDVMALAAWIGFIGMAALCFYGMVHRFIGYREPKDKAVVNAEHPTMELVFLSLDELEVWTFGTTKLSALFFYRRLFCNRVGLKRDIFDWTTIVLSTMVVAWVITFAILTFEFCPGHSVIHWGILPGHSAQCPWLYPYFEAVSISDFILDVFVIGMVFPKIWVLDMSRNRKVALSLVFLLALGGVGASCARMVVYVHYVQTGRTINDQDGYQTNTTVAYFAVLEGGLGLVSVNLPSVWYFFNGLTPERVLRSVRSFGSIGSGRSRGSKDSNSAGSNRHSSRRDLSISTHSRLPKAKAEVYDAFGGENSDAYAMQDLESVERQERAGESPDKSTHVQNLVQIRHK